MKFVFEKNQVKKKEKILNKNTNLIHNTLKGSCFLKSNKTDIIFKKIEKNHSEITVSQTAVILGLVQYTNTKSQVLQVSRIQK